MRDAIKLMLVVGVALCCTSLSAQSGVVHAVYLKDGTVVKGEIIEHVPDQSIRIRTTDGDVQVYRMGEIEKILKRKARSGSSSSSSRFELSMLGGYGSQDIYKVGLGGRIGYVWSSGFDVGVSGADHLGTTETAQVLGYSLSATAHSVYVGPELG